MRPISVFLAGLVSVVFLAPAYADEELDISANGLTKTSIYVNRGDVVSITARGSWSMGPFIGACGPVGFAPGLHSRYNLTSIANHGALIVRIGNGVWNTPGEFTARNSGVLYFSPNDNEAFNNGGSLRVTVSVNSR